MHRRARWTRPVAALFAVWFAFVLGDPGLLHRCPMHGGHGLASATASAGAEHHAMAHGEHDAASHDASNAMSHDASHHGKTSPCTCVGQCCVASVVATVPTVAAAYVPTTISLAEPTLFVALAVAPAAPDTGLPFANGPPSA